LDDFRIFWHNSKSHKLLTRNLQVHIILLPYLLQLESPTIILLSFFPNKTSFHDKLNHLSPSLKALHCWIFGTCFEPHLSLLFSSWMQNLFKNFDPFFLSIAQVVDLISWSPIHSLPFFLATKLNLIIFQIFSNLFGLN
jgi:hypothetical protein